jgi:Tfp pilus assembly protein PilF
MSQERLSTGARASPNPEANEYFEKGMLFLLHQFDLPRARLMLERALELDQKFADARAWYGFTFVLDIDSGNSNDTEALYRAEEELRHALRDDPNSGRAHSSVAALYLYQGRKELIPEEAEKALKINPDDIDAKNWLSNYFVSNGDFASAKALLNQMLAHDPLFFPARMNLADILRQEADISGAVRELEKILEQSPHNHYAIEEMARAHIDGNDLSQARRYLDSLPVEDQQNYQVKMARALLLASEGKRAEAVALMDEEVLKYAELAFWFTSEAAEFYAVLGEEEKALDWLEKAVRNGDERDAWFRRDPLLVSLHDNPRFGKILDSIAFRR